MNGKLYIFGIGGTGSRVIKSLMMLLASGVKMDVSAIVPIIVDPDFANADVTRTIELIKAYSSINSKLSFNDKTKNKFFEVAVQNVVNDYRLSIKDTKNKNFREFIGLSTMSKENKALASILFSEKNLESNMEVGFKGNPNIGSVVLNQFTNSEDFVNFAASFNPNDRIFIISSIFGGTGASGFPLLLKNLRGLKGDIPNNAAIQNSPIGAVTVMPYFSVKPDEKSDINSSTFIGKTKAALQYYEGSVSGTQSSVNVLYYIGDNKTKQYENKEGGEGQRNNAHFVELASALSIVDFANIPDGFSILSCTKDTNGKIYAPNADFREFGIGNDVQEILFSNLTQQTRGILCAPMTQFVLFSKYIVHLGDSVHRQWAKDNKEDNKFDDAFFESEFILNIKKVVNAYLEWLDEMSQNDRGFKPFKLDINESDLYSIVDGIKPTSIKALWALGKDGYDLFDAALNNEYASVSKDYSINEKFIELFYIVTKLLVEKKYKF